VELQILPPAGRKQHIGSMAACSAVDCAPIVTDGQAYALPFSVFTPIQGFGPNTAKRQPI